jgi:A/G-specific adenine glycosylase
MLLRRTTATAVARVYSKFILRFDTPDTLTRSRLSTIEKHVETLGLQKIRAQHLKKTAKKIVDDYKGEVPRNYMELSSLPGVGRYVASAVLNFAFGKPIPLVDGNVVHLISRVFDLQFNGPDDDEAWSFMESFGSDTQQSVFYWAIIDLVALVCIRSSPRCSICPLMQICSWSNKEGRI